MKATDLMVGDWVYVSGKPVKITNDDLATMLIFLDDDSKISPIPIIEEILVKNGFSEIHHPGTGATDEYSEWFFGGIKIIEWLEDWKYHYFSAGGDGAPIDFQYVHQLQHLLRLVGIEKVIKL